MNNFELANLKPGIKMTRGAKTVTGNKPGEKLDITKVQTYMENQKLQLSKNEYRTIFHHGTF